MGNIHECAILVNTISATILRPRLRVVRVVFMILCPLNLLSRSSSVTPSSSAVVAQGLQLQSAFSSSKLTIRTTSTSSKTALSFWGESTNSVTTASSFVVSSGTSSTPASVCSNRLRRRREGGVRMKSWTCHGRSHKEVIEKLVSANIVRSPIVEKALLLVDRANYITSSSINTTDNDDDNNTPKRSSSTATSVSAYTDAPQPIGLGQTISAPHMHAHVLEVIVPYLVRASAKMKAMSSNGTSGYGSSANNNFENELNILDVGCGSGYLTATLARMVYRGGSTNAPSPQQQQPIKPLTKGTVHAIDIHPQLIALTLNNLHKSDSDLLTSKTIATVVMGDGWKGLPSQAPFHAIHVGAAADVFPIELMMQLVAPEEGEDGVGGGVMVVPVGPVGGVQNLYKVERLRGNTANGDDGMRGYRKEDFRIELLFGVRYVPLVHPTAPLSSSSSSSSL